MSAFLYTRKCNFLVYKKRFALVAHSCEKKMSLRDRTQRKSFTSETLCPYLKYQFNQFYRLGGKNNGNF